MLDLCEILDLISFEEEVEHSKNAKIINKMILSQDIGDITTNTKYVVALT